MAVMRVMQTVMAMLCDESSPMNLVDGSSGPPFSGHDNTVEFNSIDFINLLEDDATHPLGMIESVGTRGVSFERIAVLARTLVHEMGHGLMNASNSLDHCGIGGCIMSGFTENTWDLMSFGAGSCEHNSIAELVHNSVSGALVMSASRTLFRTLSEEDLSVKDSMMRANQRLKKDVKSGMFVALLYAVIDSQNKILTLCSAGQTQPVHVSAKTGEGVLVETQGDTFPLGILDDSKYEETSLQLETGDKIILYTDGIVEAMNEQEEIFGFDRLLEVVKNSQTMTAETLLNEVKIRVNEFAGNAPQHDDITIIVIQAT